MSRGERWSRKFSRRGTRPMAENRLIIELTYSNRGDGDWSHQIDIFRRWSQTFAGLFGNALFCGFFGASAVIGRESLLSAITLNINELVVFDGRHSDCFWAGQCLESQRYPF